MTASSASRGLRSISDLGGTQGSIGRVLNRRILAFCRHIHWYHRDEGTLFVRYTVVLELEADGGYVATLLVTRSRPRLA
jgi:hypothetical protein